MEAATTKPISATRGGTIETLKARAEETRATLLACARALFVEQGFYATATTDIVARASLTRGAFHHHFADREAVFELIFKEVLTGLNQAARTAVPAEVADLWDRVVGSYTNYLRLIAESVECQRILLLDGPVVLGWRRWRELQDKEVTSGTIDALQMLMQAGIIKDQPAEPLGNLVQAALNEAALDIAYSDCPANAGRGSVQAFIFLLEGLRSR